MPDPTLSTRLYELRQTTRGRALPVPDVIPPAPDGLGLEWTDEGERTNGRGRYRHSTGTATRAFRTAWDDNDARGLLQECGYALDGRSVTHYGRGVPVEPVVMGEIEAVAARDMARLDTDAAPARERLASALQDIGWAMSGKTVKEGRELVERGIRTVRDLVRSRELIARTEASIDRARESLGEHVAAVCEDVRARCGDPQVQADIHEGCRYLSDRDGDLATVQNAEGWSQATSRMGHLVAQQSNLDAAHAAVGLGLLHGHRKQLPDDLRVRLFGTEARASRRRAA